MERLCSVSLLPICQSFLGELRYSCFGFLEASICCVHCLLYFSCVLMMYRWSQVSSLLLSYHYLGHKVINSADYRSSIAQKFCLHQCLNVVPSEPVDTYCIGVLRVFKGEGSRRSPDSPMLNEIANNKILSTHGLDPHSFLNIKITHEKLIHNSLRTCLVLWEK